MPDWGQIIILVDRLGACGVTLIVLCLHMLQEERIRRRIKGALDKLNGKEG